MLKNIPIIGKPNGLGINPIPVIGRFRDQVAQLFAHLFTNQINFSDGELIKALDDQIIQFRS